MDVSWKILELVGTNLNDNHVRCDLFLHGHREEDSLKPMEKSTESMRSQKILEIFLSSVPLKMEPFNNYVTLKKHFLDPQ